MLKNNIKRIIISRTDAIGDVVLTLPLCGLIKKYYPEAAIIFIGKTYTRPVIECCQYVDEFVNADDLLKLNDDDAANELKKIGASVFIHVFPNRRLAKLAKKANILYRIGTTNRLYHWGKTNKLVFLSRKRSALHEAQLNCRLAAPLGITELPSLAELQDLTGFTKLPALPLNLKGLIDQTKINVILHPKSNASGREWSLENYSALIQLLAPEKYKIFISGSDKEKLILDQWVETLPEHVTNVIGRLSLSEFIAFISETDYLVAAGTGPLHIAAACGIGAIGIFPAIKPIHPGRWQPIGKKARYLCVDKSCVDCKGNPAGCKCINDINAMQVFSMISA